MSRKEMKWLPQPSWNSFMSGLHILKHGLFDNHVVHTANSLNTWYYKSEIETCWEEIAFTSQCKFPSTDNTINSSLILSNIYISKWFSIWISLSNLTLLACDAFLLYKCKKLDKAQLPFDLVKSFSKLARHSNGYEEK